MDREALERELADLEAKNAAAPGWGAAVGARQERIKGIRKMLDADLPTAQDVRGILAPAPAQSHTASQLTDTLIQAAVDFELGRIGKPAYYAAKRAVEQSIEAREHAQGASAQLIAIADEIAMNRKNGFDQRLFEPEATMVEKCLRSATRSSPAACEGPATLWGQIAAVYGKLDIEDCQLIDREWAAMRGYIIPKDGTSTLRTAHPAYAETLHKVAQAREKRLAELTAENAQLVGLVERMNKILHSTGMQATVQEAIMRHPHYSGSATLAYGLAGSALKAVSASFSSTEQSRGR